MKSAENIAPNMRALMEKKGLSTRGMAALIDTTSTSICRWVNGKQYPGADMLLRIADAFGVTTDSLYEGRNDGH